MARRAFGDYARHFLPTRFPEDPKVEMGLVSPETAAYLGAACIGDTGAVNAMYATRWRRRFTPGMSKRMLLSQEANVLDLADAGPQRRIVLVATIILVGFWAALVFHYEMALVKRVPYPLSTFLFRPNVQLTDFFDLFGTGAVGYSVVRADHGHFPTFMLFVYLMWRTVPTSASPVVWWYFVSCFLVALVTLLSARLEAAGCRPATLLALIYQENSPGFAGEAGVV